MRIDQARVVQILELDPEKYFSLQNPHYLRICPGYHGRNIFTLACLYLAQIQLSQCGESWNLVDHWPFLEVISWAFLVVKQPLAVCALEGEAAEGRKSPRWGL